MPQSSHIARNQNLKLAVLLGESGSGDKRALLVGELEAILRQRVPALMREQMMALQARVAELETQAQDYEERIAALEAAP